MNRRTRDSFYSMWTAALLICLAVCVFVLIYTSVVKPGPGGADGALPDGQPASEGQTAEGDQSAAEGQGTDAQPAEGQEEQPAQPPSTLLGETEDLGPDYISKIVFLGDSTTYGLYSYGVLPHTQVWTPESGTLSLFNWPAEFINYFPPEDPDNPVKLTIADTAARAKPEYLVITLGLNGVASLDEEGFKGYYRDLIAAITAASPDTKIICQSIYPVIDSMTVEGIKNDRINAANGWIQALAEETGTRYLNTHDALLDSTGRPDRHPPLRPHPRI